MKTLQNVSETLWIPLFGKARESIRLDSFIVDDKAVEIANLACEKLPELNQKITLLTHLHVKEDILNLYAFENASERALFLNLNTILSLLYLKYQKLFVFLIQNLDYK